MEKILTSIKKLLGVDEGTTNFDSQIIIGINMAISALTQIGIGESSGFSLKNGDEVWSDYIPQLETDQKFIMVQGYIYCRTKLFFDPPANQTLTATLQNFINEFEWRLRVESEET